MSDMKKTTESSIARMAGNIASGMVAHPRSSTTTIDMMVIAENSVRLAYLIVSEIEKREAQR